MTTDQGITLRGGNDADTLTGGDGNDTLHGGDGIDTLDGWLGNDTLYGDDGDDTLYGGDGDDTLHGGEGTDTLWGGRGDDVLTGGRGVDTLWGGLGADTFAFAVGDGADTIVDFGDGDSIEMAGVSGGFEALDIEQVGTDTVIRYGEGDTIRLSGVTAADLGADRFRFPDAGEAPQGGDEDDGTPDGDGEGPVLEQVVRTEGDGEDPALQKAAGVTREGGKGADTLSGGAGDDVLLGRRGADTLSGGDGADTLKGGWGADTLDGGRGADRLKGGKGGDVFVFRAGDGHDTIVDFGKGDTIRLDGVTGGFAGLVIEQDGADAVVRYGDRGDTLRLTGVKVDSLGEKDFALPASAPALAQPTPLPPGAGPAYSYTGSTGAPQTKKTGAPQTKTTGSEEAGKAPAPNKGVTLNGGAGADTLKGGKGDDTLNGGKGDDTLNGGGGNDVLYGGAGDDTLSGGPGSDIFSFWGTWGHDTITDFREGDKISLLGYSGPFKEIEIEQDGADTVIRHGDGRSIRLSGVKADSIGIDDFLDGPVTVSEGVTRNGGDGDDRLAGHNGNDTLLGGKGDDMLIGERGDDVLNGGLGNDTYVFYTNTNSGHDRIIGFEDGKDIIQFTSAITAGGAFFGTPVRSFSDLEITQSGDDTVIRHNRDTITLEGVQASQITEDDFLFRGDTLTGGHADDTIHGDERPFERIYGNDGNDTLYGHGRIDQLYGGGGDDTLHGGDDDDYLSGGQGDDTLYGNDGHDRLIGAEGDDTLHGGDGNDMLMGDWRFDGEYGSGNDILTGGKGNDVFSFSGEGSNGDDRITDFEDGKDLIRFYSAGKHVRKFEDLDISQSGNDTVIRFGDSSITLEGIQADRITEDDFLFKGMTFSGGYDHDVEDDTLNGGDFDDNISGGGGDDTLNGGKGYDHLYGDSGNDTLNGGPGNDFLWGGRGDDTLTGGSGDDSLNGGYGQNILTGGSGNDIFRFYGHIDNGHDRITDFEDGKDLIRFHTVGDRVQDYDSLSFAQSGDDTVISFNGGSITLEGIQVSQITEDDFYFGF